MRTYLRFRKYPLVLAGIAGGILFSGVLLKPEEVKSAPVISESETIRLQEMAQKRTLRDISVSFARSAANVEHSLLLVRETGSTAVLWQDGSALLPSPPEPAPEELSFTTPGGREGTAKVSRTAAPFALLRLPESFAARTPPVVARKAPEPGSWVIQVSLETEGPFFTPGTFRRLRTAACGEDAFKEADTSIVLTENMNGGGIFDLDGQLIAVVGRCGDRLAAFAASELRAAVSQPPPAGAILQTAWGLKVTPLDDAAREYFRTDSGLLVSEVRQDGVAGRSGLHPGDVLVSVNGSPANSLDEVLQAVGSGAETEARVTVVRQNRKLSIPLQAPDPTATAEAEPDSEFGVAIEPPEEGIRVERVRPTSRASRAGIQPGDRILEIDGAKIRKPAELTRMLEKPAGPARYMVLGRAGSKVGILLR